MAKTKTKTAYVCTQCGYDSSKWMGKCPGCGEWNTMVEQRIEASSAGKRGSVIASVERAKPLRLSEITISDSPRIKLPGEEFNRVLGGGLVPGSVTLIGGEPGIGKSTLILQTILSMRSGRTILYVSGEESPTQLRMRADRLSKAADNTFILSETSLEAIFDRIKTVKPDLIIVDSIQTVASSELESLPGSVAQVRECAAAFLRYAKTNNVPVILVGHINKDGAIAGPKVLEHIVDTVLQFEGDRQFVFRLLRAIKNRFGSTSEIGIYEMAERGLREVKNPSETLLGNGTEEKMSGTAVGVALEGGRPFLIETQALVSTAAYGTPQRSTSGFDQRRLNMLLAVLEKRAKFRLDKKDVFLNIVGGLKVNDPALDMSVVSAIMSSNFDITLPPLTAFAGEIGLSGEIRAVTRIDRRIAEAEKLGFTTIHIPAGNLREGRDRFSIKIVESSRIDDLFRNLFG